MDYMIQVVYFVSVWDKCVFVYDRVCVCVCVTERVCVYVCV